MKFLKARSRSADESSSAFHDYARYLDEIHRRLAPNVYAFASAPWHYDFTDHRCPHDAWLETITVSERSVANEPPDITLILLGAYHDGRLHLKYQAVRRYELFGQIVGTSHGDWLLDEITVSESGAAAHEIVFSTGTTIYLEFMDLTIDWIPGPVAQALHR